MYLFKQNSKKPKHKDGAIGVGLGIVSFTTYSDQKTDKSPRPFKKYEKKLAQEQKSLARKKKGSNRWKQQKYKSNESTRK